MPTISVIVPVYKVEPYLKKCIDSILTQTFKDFDLVLVDDGSPDNCGKICDAYASQDKRVHVIHQKNGGLSAARNAGIDWAIANSPSQYVTFIDSDDWVDPQYLYELNSAITLGAQIACVGCLKESNSRLWLSLASDWHSESPEDYWLRFQLFPQSACGKIFNKSLFKIIRFPAGKLHEDEFTMHLLLFQHQQLAVKHEGLYHYRSRPGSITNVAWTPKRMDSIEALQEELEFFQQNGYERATDLTVERLMLQMTDAIVGMRQCDTDFKTRPTEYRAFIESNLKKSKLGFWPHRAIHRALHPLYFSIMWLPSMLKNAITAGKDSWLINESLPVLKSCVDQLCRTVLRRHKN